MRPRSGRAPESCWRGPASGPARWPPWRRRGATSSRRPGLRRIRSSGRDCSTVQGGWRIRTPSSKPQKVSSRPLTNCLLPLDTHAAAAVSARLAQIEAVDRTRRTGTLAPGSCFRRGCRRRTGRGRRRGRSPGSDMALAFSGHYEQAREPTEFALRLSQALRLPQAAYPWTRDQGNARASERSSRGSFRVAAPRAPARTRARPDRASIAGLRQPIRRLLSELIAIPRRSTPSRTASSSPAGSALGIASCSCSPRRATRLRCPAGGKRRSRSTEELPEDQLRTNTSSRAS